MLKENYKIHFETLKTRILNKEYTSGDEGIASLSGSASRIVFLVHLGRVEPNRRSIYEKIMRQDVNVILECIEQHQVSEYNINGLVGFGSAVAFAVKMGYLEDANDQVLSQLDDFVIQCACASFNTDNFDLFYGGFGCLQYLFQRTHIPKVKEHLPQFLNARIFSQIEEKDFSFLGQEEEGTIDFSGAHGLASVIFFLSKFVEVGINVERCISLMRISSNFIWSHCRETENGWRIPDYVNGEKSVFSPLRWCHGELGIIPALSRANVYLKDDALQKLLTSVIDTIAGFRANSGDNLVTAIICHGTLGVAHIFNRLHHNYQTKQVGDAAAYWYAKSDEIMRSEIGFSERSSASQFAERTGILSGIEGIALGVMTFLYPDEYEWDYHFLLS